jgi:hypothetical protein
VLTPPSSAQIFDINDLHCIKDEAVVRQLHDHAQPYASKDLGMRVIEFKKNNYGPISDTIMVRGSSRFQNIEN